MKYSRSATVRFFSRPAKRGSSIMPYRVARRRRRVTFLRAFFFEAFFRRLAGTARAVFFSLSTVEWCAAPRVMSRFIVAAETQTRPFLAVLRERFLLRFFRGMGYLSRLVTLR